MRRRLLSTKDDRPSTMSIPSSPSGSQTAAALSMVEPPTKIERRLKSVCSVSSSRS